MVDLGIDIQSIAHERHTSSLMFTSIPDVRRATTSSMLLSAIALHILCVCAIVKYHNYRSTSIYGDAF